VSVEANGKQSFQRLTIPNRILFYGKIVKGERRGKRKQSFQRLSIPNRILSYEKTRRGRFQRKTADSLAGSVLKNTNVERLVFIYTYFIADLQPYISFCALPKCRDAFRAM
jgi:hypothetical protein